MSKTKKPAKAAQLPLDDHLRAFLLTYKSKRTQQSYEAQIRGYTRWLVARHIPALEVTREHVQAFADHLEAEGRAGSTIAGTLCTLTVFYEHLIEADLYTKNPAKKVPRPEVSNESTRQAPSLEQCMSMNDLAAIGPDPREHLLFCLLLFNALRNEEALQLTLASLQNKSGRTVYQFIGKGGRPAIVTLAEEPTLLALERCRTHLTVPTARVMPWSRHQTNRLIQDLAYRAGVRDVHVTPHSLRHAAITIGFDSGMQPHEVQAMARHTNPQTTSRYDRHKAQRATKVSDSIAGLAISPYARTA